MGGPKPSATHKIAQPRMNRTIGGTTSGRTQISCALAVATCLVGLTEASAQDRCRVMDPTNTPLNVRTSPDGNIVGTLSNGTLVKILDRPSNVRGRTWVYVGRYEDRVPPRALAAMK